MSYKATVFNVMIASPGDVTVERSHARNVINEWNFAHSASRQTVLMPVGWETHSTPMMGDRPQAIINSQLLETCDLLVAIFWTRLGTDTGEYESGTVEEIEKQIKSGKPTMIYFSSAPAVPESVDPKQYKALTKFRDSCQSRGLFQAYGTSTEFIERFRQHLAKLINENAHFAISEKASSLLVPIPIPVPATTVQNGPIPPNLSKEARDLLVTAANGDGSILVAEFLSGLSIDAGGRTFVDSADTRTEARWKAALGELYRHGLIDNEGDVKDLTERGFQIADLLKT